MANKPRAKMPISERAKQFMPFSALKGLDEAIAQKEKQFEKRRVLTDEEAECLNRKLNSLGPHQRIELIYHKNGQHLRVSGEISVFDTVMRVLQIDGTTVNFDDIEEIERADQLR